MVESETRRRHEASGETHRTRRMPGPTSSEPSCLKSWRELDLFIPARSYSAVHTTGAEICPARLAQTFSLLLASRTRPILSRPSDATGNKTRPSAARRSSSPLPLLPSLAACLGLYMYLQKFGGPPAGL